jgi:tRNA(Ile)-lysidine synthase
MRVGIRSKVIPRLERALGRNVRSTLVRSAALLRRDAEFLDELAAAARPDVLVHREPDQIMLHRDRLSVLAAPIAGRIVRRALLDLGVLPEASHVEAVLGLVTANRGRSVVLPDGLLARREREYVRLSRPSLRPA